MALSHVLASPSPPPLLYHLLEASLHLHHRHLHKTQDCLKTALQMDIQVGVMDVHYNSSAKCFRSYIALVLSGPQTYQVSCIQRETHAFCPHLTLSHMLECDP